MGRTTKTQLFKYSILVFIVSFFTLIITATPSSALTCTSGTSVVADDGNTYCVGDGASATTSATASVTVAAACTLSSTSAEHSATMTPGVWTPGIGTTNFFASCNDPGGYAVYAIGYSNSEWKNNTLINSSNPSITIPTRAYDSSYTSNSYWSMQLAPGTGGSAATIVPSFAPGAYNDNYAAIPSTYTLVAYKNSMTSGSSAASFTSTYGAFIHGSQAPGTYDGKVKFTLVHPYNAPAPPEPLADSDCSANGICYAPNAADIEGTMVSTVDDPMINSITASPIAGRITYAPNAAGSMQRITSNSTAQLIAPNYSREGYGFAGWSPDFNAVETHEAAVAANDPSMEPIIYGPNETIATGDVSTYGLILYPVWIESTGTIQDWSGCSGLTRPTYDATNHKMNATLSSVTALTDQRDGNVYTVAKLIDGNCWMTENLRLNAENSTNASLAQGYASSATYGNFIGLANSENTGFGGGTSPPYTYTPNSIYGIDDSAVVNIWVSSVETQHPNFRMPRYNNNNTNRSLTASYNSNDPSTFYQWYSYGNYYTWPAAMANTKYYNSPTFVDQDGYTSDTVGTSICPHGWKLPYGGDSYNGITSGGLYYLNTLMSNGTTAQGSMDWRMFPNNFVYAGYIDDYATIIHERGSTGRTWSSTAGAWQNSLRLQLVPASVIPGTYNGMKYNGNPVRCITQ